MKMQKKDEIQGSSRGGDEWVRTSLLYRPCTVLYLRSLPSQPSPRFNQCFCSCARSLTGTTKLAQDQVVLPVALSPFLLARISWGAARIH